MSSMRLFLIAAGLVLFACTPERKDAPSTVHPERQAPQNVGDSFDVNVNKVSKEEDRKGAQAQAAVPEGGIAAKAGKLVIKKSALGKAFLLSPTMIVASNNTIIDHLQPKVVAFERSGSSVALFELNTRAIYDNMRSDKLLETMKVVGETEDAIELDWNFTLTAVPTEGLGSTGLSDIPATGDSSMKTILPVQKNFLRKLEIVNNAVEIEQVSEIQVQNLPFTIQGIAMSILTNSGMTMETKSVTLKLNVSLRPYIQSKTFRPRLSPFNKGLGAFEIGQPRQHDGTVDYFATVWDLSDGPITYAITKGTPAEHIDAIRDGLLYWNRVAGREIIKVVTDADPERTPTERVVLVHWVPWAQAGFARASIQSDPITGEILRADVFMTSFFTDWARKAVRSALMGSDPLKGYALQLSSFRSASTCHLERPPESLLRQATLAIEGGGNIEGATNDFIRLIVAHEVGHTLGMRHNFAGSLVTELKDAESFRAAEKAYLAGERPDGAVMTSTVMDYVFGIPGALVGAAMKKTSFTYDQKFIEFFYNKEFAFEKGDLPPFCSDITRGQGHVGCAAGDYGINAMENAKSLTRERLSSMVRLPLHSIVAALHPKNAADRKDMLDVMNKLSTVNIADVVGSLMTELTTARSLLSGGVHYYDVILKEGAMGWANRSEYEAAQTAKLQAELASVGGVWGLFASILPLDEQGLPQRGWLKKILNEQYSKPEFKKGVTLEGVAYELTPAEDKFIGKLIEKYADRAEDVWVAVALEKFTFKKPGAALMSLGPISLGGSGNDGILRDDLSQGEWWPKLAKVAGSVITASDKIVKVNINGIEMGLAEPRHALEVRKKMVDILSPEGYRLHVPALERAELIAAKKSIIDVLAKVLPKPGMPLATAIVDSSTAKAALAVASMDSAAKTWIDREIDMLSALESVK